MDIPEHLSDSTYKQLQITLVDCPGHASLIRTIIGGIFSSVYEYEYWQSYFLGAQIIDLMFLVIDVTKGIQTQTV